MMREFRRLNRRLPLACLLGLGAVMLAGCSEQAPKASPVEPLKVGLVSWPPFELFRLAGQEQMYSDVHIEFQEFSSLREISEALREGRLDVASLSADLFLQKLEQGQLLKVILITDVSDGGDAVLARPEISSLEELRGARVGLESSHLGRFVLTRALQTVNLNLADVETVLLDEGRHVDAYLSGEVDAVVAYDPRRTQLLREGARVLFDSSQMPHEIIDVLVAREAITQSHPDVLRRLVKGYFDAREAFLQNPNVISKRLAPRLGISQTEFINTLSGIRLIDAHDNYHLLAGENPLLVESLEPIAAFMKETGELQELPPLEYALTTDFLPPHSEE